MRLSQSIEKRLQKLARRTGRTKSYYVREAILKHLGEFEDLYLAEGALERIRSGEERTHPLEASHEAAWRPTLRCLSQRSGNSANSTRRRPSAS